ncbi:hypothetical protein FNV43_RR06099 [Rhamnella rubrinervis]|uniref:Uncharacterized protein n=1 Tax=Rhamnella rubrinervis TaxID=2594499 RepID=A0A8K0MLN3_9ROSA|nr:hypothetical protein FNV43_RR06099 [Rhamnella rubrinervis]
MDVKLASEVERIVKAPPSNRLKANIDVPFKDESSVFVLSMDFLPNFYTRGDLRIGEELGGVHRSTINAKSVVSHRFLRFRIEIKVENPLPAGFLQTKDNGTEFWVQFNQNDVNKKWDSDRNLWGLVIGLEASLISPGNSIRRGHEYRAYAIVEGALSIHVFLPIQNREQIQCQPTLASRHVKRLEVESEADRRERRERGVSEGWEGVNVEKSEDSVELLSSSPQDVAIQVQSLVESPSSFNPGTGSSRYYTRSKTQRKRRTRSLIINNGSSEPQRGTRGEDGAGSSGINSEHVFSRQEDFQEAEEAGLHMPLPQTKGTFSKLEKLCRRLKFEKFEFSEKRVFWNDLAADVEEDDSPWMLIGDLNEVVECSDKLGGRSLIGRRNLEIIVSDHAPIILCFDGEEKLFSHFRFLKAWTTDGTSHKVVQADWTSGELGRKEYLNTLNHLQMTSIALKNWNQDHFGWTHTTIKNLEAELKFLQSQEDRGMKQIGDRQKEIIKELGKQWERHESILKQKSRETWLAEGDKNSSFFHASTLIRRRRNRIEAIKEGLEWVTGRKAIAEYFIKEFQNLYRSEIPTLPACIHELIKPSISEEDNKVLMSISMIEEVK